MHVYFWNVRFDNTRIDEALSFITTSNADLFVLQEVPPDLLLRLRSLTFFCADAVEEDFDSPLGPLRRHIVVLSKTPIRSTESFPLPNYDRDSLRKSFFLLTLRTLGIIPLIFKGVGNRHGLCVTIDTIHVPLRIITAHAPITGPVDRLVDVNVMLSMCADNTPCIVCGDFNILESPHITPINWLLGGRFRDIFAWHSERSAVQKLFTQHRLTNPLRHRITHPLSRSQLDHVLVSENLHVTDSGVIPDRHGSDHHPVFVEIS